MLLPLSLLLAVGCAAAEPHLVLTFPQPPTQAVKPGGTALIPLRLANDGDAPYELSFLDCKASGFLSVSTPALTVVDNPCPNDEPRKVSILPGRALELLVRLKAARAAPPGRLPFQLTLTTAYPPVDSEPAALTIAGRRPRPESPTPPQTLSQLKPRAPTDAARASQQHYLSGMIYFQKGDYLKARLEWKLALTLDPSNADAQAGLDRLDKLSLDR